MREPLNGIGTIPGVYLTQTFSEHPEVYSQFGLKGHNGLDWGCPTGTPVYAPVDGELSFETETQNFGKGYGMNARIFSPYIKDGATRMEMVFGHLCQYGTPGSIKQGEQIALSDNTGFSTGAHLHFGIRLWNDSGIINYNNGYLGWVDPMPFLKENMAKRFFIKDGEKIGAFVADGFALGGAFAKDSGALESLKSALEFKGDEPTLELPPSVNL